MSDQEEGKEVNVTMKHLNHFIADWNALPFEEKLSCRSEAMKGLHRPEGVGLHDPLPGNWERLSHGK